MITMFWIFSIFFGILCFIETRKFFSGGLNTTEIYLWILSIVTFAISVGIIKAGSWHNAAIFFTG